MLNQAVEGMLEAVVQRVKGELTKYMEVTLIGGLPVMLEHTEFVRWDTACIASDEFRAMEAAELDHFVARERFKAEPQSAGLETVFRESITKRGAAKDAMRMFASRWYAELCRERGIRRGLRWGDSESPKRD